MHAGSHHSDKAKKQQSRSAQERWKATAETLIGKIFGGRRIIAYIPRQERRTRLKTHAWLSECIRCGNERAYTLGELKRNKAGCQQCAARTLLGLRPYEALFRVAKKHWRSKKWSFSLSYKDFLLLIAEGRCHYCHDPLRWAEYCVGKNGGRYQLDRKDNALGYSKPNLVPCCWRCNQAKGDRFTYEEWMRMTMCLRVDRASKIVMT